MTFSGVFRIWQRGGAWRARGAQAYNGGLGAKPPAGSRGRNRNGNRKFAHFFLKFAGKWQKRTFSYKVACKKFSWSGQRGASHRDPLNTPLMTLYDTAENREM